MYMYSLMNQMYVHVSQESGGWQHCAIYISISYSTPRRYVAGL